jgi:hypothetical protein
MSWRAFGTARGHWLGRLCGRVLGPCLLAWAGTSALAAPGLPLPVAPPAATEGATPAQLLTALIEHSRQTAQLQDGRLLGPGAKLLRELGASAQHVMFGEQHGNQGIAELATAWWADLADAGYTHAALEVEPWVAAALERTLRDGGLPAWKVHVRTQGGARNLAFVGWDAEVQWVQAVLRQRPATAGPVLWGLDQVFIASAAPRLREVAQAAHSPAARALAAELERQALADAQWLGRVPPEELHALLALLQHPGDAPAARKAQALLQSRQIYGPFSGGGGETWVANTQREDLMRAAFAEHHRRAEASPGPGPRVMLKFGAYHLFRGASPLLVQGLGGFVAEWAAARGQAVLSALVLCGPGSQAARYDGAPVPCDQPLNPGGDWHFLAPHVATQGLTVFDLRTWRLRPRRLAGLPPEVLRVVGSYDLLVFAPRSPASAFLDTSAPVDTPEVGTRPKD